MKFWLLAIGVFLTLSSQAQFGFYAEGGGNYTGLTITRNPGGSVDGKADFGWDVGAGVEYHTQFGYFLFLGTGVSQQNFNKDSAGSSISELRTVVADYKYKPLFLNFPFGIGYQFNFSKDLALRVYGGITSQIGVGGRIIRNATYYASDSTGGTPVVIEKQFDDHKMHFGRSIQVQNEFRSDMANAFWGFNAGVGLNFSKSIEVTLIYQGVFTNILPGGDGVPEIDKLQALTLNLKYYFVRGYYKNEKMKY